MGNAGASGVSEAKMKKLLAEDKERIDFEEDHMVRLVSLPRTAVAITHHFFFSDQQTNRLRVHRRSW